MASTIRPRLLRMRAGKVQPVTGDPVLGRDRHAPLLQLTLNIQLKGIKRLLAQAAAHGGPARGGELQVLPQQLHTLGAGTARVHVMVGETGHQVNPGPSPGDRNIQAALPALLVQGTEPVGQRAVRRLVVAHAQDDDVAFVSLHPLDVLDERTVPPAPWRRRDPGSGRSQRQDAGEAPPLCCPHVVGPEGDHPKRLLRTLTGVFKNKVNHPLNLVRMRPWWSGRRSVAGPARGK